MEKSPTSLFRLSPYLPPDALSFAWTVLYKASTISIKIHRLQRRVEHPYLYVLGSLLDEQMGDDAMFLKCAAQVLRTARIAHGIFDQLFDLQQISNSIFSTLSVSSPFCSFGYLDSFHKRAPSLLPSLFQSPHALLEIVLQRWTSLCEQIEDLLEKLKQTWFLFFEMWLTLTESRSDATYDLLIELKELYDFYDSSDATSFFSKAKRLAPLIDRLFEDLRMPVSSSFFFSKFEEVIAHIEEIKRQMELHAKKTSAVWTSSHRVAHAILFPTTHILTNYTN